VRNTLQQQSL